MSAPRKNQAKLKNIRQQASFLLRDAGLDRVVSPREIESELAEVEHLYDSALMLGIVTRCSESAKSGLLDGLIPLITDWQNYIPRKELAGLSPYEYEKRYPRGHAECWIINKLLQTYEGNLGSLAGLAKPPDLAMDFAIYQEKFFELIPALQPFPEMSITMSHQEIIVEERKRAGHPSLALDQFKAVMFAHELPDHASRLIRHIENVYANSTKTIGELGPQSKYKAKKLGQILIDLASIEPFMKCMKSAPSFYGTFAGAAIMMREYTMAEELLRQSLSINPRFTPARQMLRYISAIREGLPLPAL